MAHDASCVADVVWLMVCAVLRMVCGVYYMMPVVWRMVYDACSLCGAWCVGHGLWRMVYDVCCVAHGVWPIMVCGVVCCVAHGVWPIMVCGVCCMMCAAWRMAYAV